MLRNRRFLRDSRAKARYSDLLILIHFFIISQPLAIAPPKLHNSLTFCGKRCSMDKSPPPPPSLLPHKPSLYSVYKLIVDIACCMSFEQAQWVNCELCPMVSSNIVFLLMKFYDHEFCPLDSGAACASAALSRSARKSAHTHRDQFEGQLQRTFKKQCCRPHTLLMLVC